MVFVLQVVEHACSIPSLMQGETMHNVSRDMDTHSYRMPLGVTAGWSSPLLLTPTRSLSLSMSFTVSLAYPDGGHREIISQSDSGCRITFLTAYSSCEANIELIA